MKKLTACLAAAACLGLGANALAGSSDFGGRIEKGGKIGIDTDGGTDHVDRIRHEKFPATCNGNPNYVVKATWVPASDVPITANEFAVDLEDPTTGSTLHMTGKLKNGGAKIVGEIKAKLFFNNGNTKCTTRLRNYSAVAGRDTTRGDPKAAYRRVP